MVEKKQINFPRYEHYKDSGIDWIGEIPAHWGLSKFKFIATFEKASLPKRLVGDSNYPVYMTMDYLRGGKAAQWVLDRTAKVVEKGEVLLLWDGANAGEFIKSRRGVPPSTVAHIIFLNIEKSFGWYFTSVIERQLRLTTVGMGIPHVSGLELSNNLVTIPPLPEQTAIAQFLDHKTAQIDRAIAIKEAQIKLLNERKQIMIQEAVTKGLDPSVPMKDSGIEWIGEIPAHWEVRKIKNIMIMAGRGTTPNYVDYSDYCVMNQATFSKGYWDLKNIRYTSKPENSRGRVVKGDILLASTGGGVLGKVAYYDIDEEQAFIADSHVTILRANTERYESKYAYYFLSINYDLINGVLAQGATNQIELQTDWMRSFLLPVPPLKEQKRIVSYLDQCEVLLLKSQKSLQTQIQTLKEYKTTLINEAVTGKIKVY